MNYIIDFDPVIKDSVNYEYIVDIENKIINKISIDKDELLFFLDYICYLVRVHINKRLDNFDYKCDLFQSVLSYYFQHLDCKVNACMTQNVITKDIIGHSFLIISFLVDDCEQSFLLDPSYIQFFKKEKCQNTNYIINNQSPHQILLTPDPGYFVKEENNKLAQFLINHGYIILNEDTAKMYGDSFLNTKVGVNSENLIYQSIPGSVYINSFLKGNEKLSKSEEELYELDLLLRPFNENNILKV